MPPSSGNNTPSATEFTSSMSENGEAASVTSKGEGSTSEKKNAGATFGFGPRDRRSRLPHNDLRVPFHKHIVPMLSKDVHVIYGKLCGNFLFDIVLFEDVSSNIKFYEGIMFKGIELSRVKDYIAAYTGNQQYMADTSTMQRVPFELFRNAIVFAAKNETDGAQKYLHTFDEYKKTLEIEGADVDDSTGIHRRLTVRKTRSTARPHQVFEKARPSTEKRDSTDVKATHPWLLEISQQLNKVFLTDRLPDTEEDIDAVFKAGDNIRRTLKDFMNKVASKGKDVRRTLSGQLYPFLLNQNSDIEAPQAGTTQPLDQPSVHGPTEEEIQSGLAVLEHFSIMNKRKTPPVVDITPAGSPIKKQRVIGTPQKRPYVPKVIMRDCIIVNAVKWNFIAKWILTEERSLEETFRCLQELAPDLGGVVQIREPADIMKICTNIHALSIEQSKWIIATIDGQFLPKFGRFPTHNDDWGKRSIGGAVLSNESRQAESLFFLQLQKWFEANYQQEDLPRSMVQRNETDAVMGEKMRCKASRIYWNFVLNGHVLSYTDKKSLLAKGQTAPPDGITVAERMKKFEAYGFGELTMRTAISKDALSGLQIVQDGVPGEDANLEEICQGELTPVSASPRKMAIPHSRRLTIHGQEAHTMLSNIFNDSPILAQIEGTIGPLNALCNHANQIDNRPITANLSDSEVLAMLDAALFTQALEVQSHDNADRDLDNAELEDNSDVRAADGGMDCPVPGGFTDSHGLVEIKSRKELETAGTENKPNQGTQELV